MINQLSDRIKNIIGYSTPQKYIILESDDWGSIRMPSVEVFEQLKLKGLAGENNRYQRFDTLANDQDLSGLFEVLHSVKDANGNPAKMTPVSVVANPDYQKISVAGFKEFHYVLFTDTLRDAGHQKELDLWKEGISGGFFVPQYHGREHLNVAKWLKALQAGDENTHYAFNLGVYGVPLTQGQTYLAAYDYFEPEELQLLDKISEDGLNRFEEVFGFRANYFVPPNGPLSSKIHAALARYGIKAIQTARFIYHEPVGFGKTRNRIRYFGMRNRNAQMYMLRNAFFEPSEPGKNNEVENCLLQIENAFQYNKPAIISSHRVNFIGALVSENRDSGLRQLRELLQKIIKKWPDVQFLTSGELTELMTRKRNDHQ